MGLKARRKQTVKIINICRLVRGATFPIELHIKIGQTLKETPTREFRFKTHLYKPNRIKLNSREIQ